MKKYTGITVSFIIIIIGIIRMQNNFYLRIASGQTKDKAMSLSLSITPFYWVLLLVGGCIAITLTYVSWRKYKGEETKEVKDTLKKDKTVD